ncbi:MAG TPA: hypothetical protein EYP10_08535 [Armatimonadetes bacterium]|nr:hypothetical protein [Armatimonadota bacterium]
MPLHASLDAPDKPLDVTLPYIIAEVPADRVMSDLIAQIIEHHITAILITITKISEESIYQVQCLQELTAKL